MAEGKKVGSVYIDLGLKTSTLESGLKKGEGAVRGWAGKIGAFFTGAFVVAAGMAMVKFVSLVANAMKKAAGLIKNLFINAIKATSDEQGEIKKLANEMGNLEKATETIDALEQKSIKWKVATDDLIAGYTVLRRFFDEKFIQKNLEDIASASKQLGIPISELAQMVAGLGEGMLSARRLLALGVSKESLGAAGVKFDLEDPDKIISQADEVVTAIMKIWKDKYTNGAGKDVKTLGGFIIQLKNLWDIFLEDVGKAGVYDLVINKLQGIVAWVQNNSEQIKKWATDISKFFSDTFNGLTAVLSKVLGIDLNNVINNVVKEVKAPEINTEGLEEVKRNYEAITEAAKNTGMEFRLTWEQYKESNRSMWELADSTKEVMTIEEQYNQMKRGYADNNLELAISLEKYKEIYGETAKEVEKTDIVPEAPKLIPFWEKIVDGIGDGKFSKRLGDALAGVISGLGNNKPLMDAASSVGVTIAGGIISGIVTTIGDWEIEYAREHKWLGLGMGGGAGWLAGELQNMYIDNLGRDNSRISGRGPGI